MCSIVGCGKSNSERESIKSEMENDNDKTETEETARDDKNENDTPEGEVDNEEKEEQQGWDITVYYVDEQTAEIVGKSVKVYDEYDIWEALKTNGILTDKCELLAFNLDEANKKIDIDFNSSTGDRIRSMGTTGETEILGCIINTYLEAYQCEGIRLTEEGNVVETSHGADTNGYSEKITF